MRVKINGEEVKPIFWEITSNWLQQEPFRNRPHRGIDLNLPSNTPLYSPVEGEVSKVVDYGDKDLGKGIFIKTSDNREVLFGHLSDIDVKKGAIVRIGEKIGESGRTGHATGDHLHIGYREGNDYLNPRPVVDIFRELYSNPNALNNVQKNFGERVEISNSHPPIEVIAEFAKNFNKVVDYLRKVKTEGFFQATYHKSPSQFWEDALIKAVKEFFEICFEFNELLFLFPAIIAMFYTFFVGKNRFKRFIIPGWLIYAYTEITFPAYFENL